VPPSAGYSKVSILLAKFESQRTTSVSRCSRISGWEPPYGDANRLRSRPAEQDMPERAVAFVECSRAGNGEISLLLQPSNWSAAVRDSKLRRKRYASQRADSHVLAHSGARSPYAPRATSFLSPGMYAFEVETNVDSTWP